MAEQTVLRLPDDELDRIVEIAHRSWAEAVVEVFKAFGVDRLDPTVVPWEYAIPQDQWHALSTACGGGPGGSLAKVNHLMDWMNYGPSSC